VNAGLNYDKKVSSNKITTYEARISIVGGVGNIANWEFIQDEAGEKEGQYSLEIVLRIPT
jgi:hypothetical protein